MATSTDIPGELFVLDTERNRTKLRRAEPHIGEETLGVYLSGNGSDTEERTALRKKTVAFADWMNQAYLNPFEVKYSLTSVLFKTLEYPMESTCLSKDDWTHIMSPALLSSLPKLGIWHNFPREIVYGPEYHQGIGLKDPFIWQNLLHIRVLIQEGAKSSLTGRLLQSTVEQLRLETGYNDELTSIPEDILDSTTERTWIAFTITLMK